jgi:hypothetical protein
MFTKTSRVSIVLILLIIGPSACENCGHIPDYFTILGVKISNLKFIGEAARPSVAILPHENVEWDKYYMGVNFERTYFSQNKSSFGASLFADCGSKGDLGAKVGIDTLYVVAMKDYNDHFHQNDTLNSIVRIGGLVRAPEGFNSLNSIQYYINENRTSIREYNFSIKLSQPPFPGTGDYKFRLIYKLDNGEVFENDNDIVHLIY